VDKTYSSVLITGASGLLGANLVRHYAPSSQCTGWYATKPISFEGATTEQIDLTDHESVSSALDRIKPDLIVHCAAATDVEWCEKHPELAKAINEDATVFLAKKAIELNAKFVFTSTDSVFDGKSGNYSESDAPGPLNSYATGKVRTEEAVADTNPEALLIRSYFYGHSPTGNRSLLEWVLVRALANHVVPGFIDSYFSPIGVLDFAEALDVALAVGYSGFLHLGSKNAISKYEFARLVMESNNCDMSLLQPTTVDEIGLSADRPRNTSLNVDLLEKLLGRTVSTVEQGMLRAANESVSFN
jgi:dTDP-4-dehydrorhamnose reductase